MITAKVDSILPDFDLDLNRVAVNVRGSSDPPALPKGRFVSCLIRSRFSNLKTTTTYPLTGRRIPPRRPIPIWSISNGSCVRASWITGTKAVRRIPGDKIFWQGLTHAGDGGEILRENESTARRATHTRRQSMNRCGSSCRARLPRLTFNRLKMRLSELAKSCQTPPNFCAAKPSRNLKYSLSRLSCRRDGLIVFAGSAGCALTRRLERRQEVAA